MNKQTYLTLALTTFMASMSSPLWADICIASKQHPVTIKASATSTEDQAKHRKSVAI